MKSLTLLWQYMAYDIAMWCSASTSGSTMEDSYRALKLDKDFSTVATRFENEGVSFLTITLPTFTKDFERGLSVGRIDPSFFSGFHTRKGRSAPEFLQGLMNLVFDSNNGTLLDTPNINAIFGIRQLTAAFSKILLPCSDAREKDAIDGYVQTEKEVAEFVGSDLRRADTSALADVFRVLFVDGLVHVESLIDSHGLRPKHGPGSTANRVLGNKKYSVAVWPERLENIFNYVDYALPNHRHYSAVDRVNFLAPGEEQPVRIVLVPKTLKTPRVIAIEPSYMQYMQQALASAIVESVEKPFYRMTPYGEVRQNASSNGFIGFSDQEPNQLLAQKGSLDGSLATIDLSEASDRVSNSLVNILFEAFPGIAQGIAATRSERASVPGHGVIRLAKFASMGSALTFPVEAMAFLAIIFYAIGKEQGVLVTPKFINQFRGRVRVYGDDIIVPTEYADAVIESLESFGFKVNSNKSFWTGKFRESCGKDYYSGVDVSITRVRRVFPIKRRNSQEVVSAFSLANQLYKAGMWQSANFVVRQLKKVKVPTPVVGEESPALGLHSHQGYVAERVCKRLHRPVVLALKTKADIPRNEVSGVFALQKVLLTSGVLPNPDRRHLEYSGRPLAVDTKQGWVVAY